MVGGKRGAGTPHIILGLLDDSAHPHGCFTGQQRFLRDSQVFLHTVEMAQDSGGFVLRRRHDAAHEITDGSSKRLSCPVVSPNHCWISRL